MYCLEVTCTIVFDSGSKLNIAKTVDWTTLLTVVLNNVVTLSTSHETQIADCFYSCYRATAFHNVGMFEALLKHFTGKQKVRAPVISCRVPLLCVT